MTNMKNYVFENPPLISREEAEDIFRSHDSDEITRTLVQIALHDSDWHWVQEKCLQFAKHPDASVRAAAATCFGHIARIHHKLDASTVLPVLKRLLHDPEVSGYAENAYDDIEIFLGRDVGDARKSESSNLDN